MLYFWLMKKLVFLLFSLFLTAGLYSQKAMQTTDLFRFQRIGGHQVSPNGEYLVFIVTSIDMDANRGKRRVEMIHLKTGTQETIISEEYNPSDLAFTPDGKRLGFLSAKSGSDQLWEMDLQTKEFSNV